MSDAIEATLNTIIEQVWNNRRLDLMPEVFTDDAQMHIGDTTLASREAIRETFIRPFQAAFPDLHLVVENLVVADDKAAMRFRGRGTHQGDFDGKAATGKTLAYEVIAIFHTRNGRVAEVWAQSDRAQRFAAL